MAQTNVITKSPRSSPDKTRCENLQTEDFDNSKVDIKQKLSAHVHCRMLNSTENSNSGNAGHEATAAEPKLSSPNIKPESGIVDTEVRKSAATEGDTETSVAAPQTPNAVGSFMAGSVVLSNSILDEVLNEKKMALLQSSEVIKFLQEKCKHTGK